MNVFCRIFGHKPVIDERSGAINVLRKERTSVESNPRFSKEEIKGFFLIVCCKRCHRVLNKDLLNSQLATILKQDHGADAVLDEHLRSINYNKF